MALWGGWGVEGLVPWTGLLTILELYIAMYNRPLLGGTTLITRDDLLLRKNTLLVCITKCCHGNC